MTDVSILDFDAGKDLRRWLSLAVWERWFEEPNTRFIRIQENTIDAKRIAEQLSKSMIYVVADNDCLILGRDFILKGLSIMSRHPEYALLAATSISDGEYPNGCERQDFPEVIERHAVGGISFVRKGLLTEFNPCSTTQVDDTICSELFRKGYKTGSMPGMRFNHLGAGYSITSPMHWMVIP